MLEFISSFIVDSITSLLTVDIIIIAFSAYSVYVFMQIVFHFVAGKRIKYK